MYRFRKSLSIAVPLLAGLLFSSCAKDGATGPTGPAGKDGNANVITRSFTVYDSTWTMGGYSFNPSVNSTTTWFAKVYTVVDSAITSGVVDSGMVLVYFRSYSGDSAWVPLPFSFLDFGRDFSYRILDDFKQYALRIYIFPEPNSSGATVPLIANMHFPPYTFKYLIVSGSSYMLMKREGVDFTNLRQVENYLRD